ncbi:MAG: hypothetical protein Q8S73_44705 [Deltaproteobacteria bacterium]|nr:hypothetical protein [Myxococcales bacterium]MDP3221268.1 hypothetical protein [Deltaproteobacteria bacterium]
MDALRLCLPVLLVASALACRRPRSTPPRSVVVPDVAPSPAPIDVGGPALPDASVDDALAGATPATWPTLSATEPMAPGCFAWSPRLNVAACLVGQSGTNLNENTVWSVRFRGEPDSSALSLVEPTDAGFIDRPDEDPPPPAVLARLRARLDADGFIDLRPLRRELTAAAFAWSPGMTVRAVHRRTFGGGDNAAERATDRIELQWQPRGPRTLLTAWDDRPVAEPRLRAYVIPGGRYLVLDAVGTYGDEGEYGVHSLAWLCDRETRSCR